MKIMPSHGGKPATIRNGESVLHGRITGVFGQDFNFRVNGSKYDNSFTVSEWDAEISLLPTEPGIYAVDGNHPASSRIFKRDNAGVWTELTSSDRHASVVDYLGHRVTRYEWTLVPLVPKGS